MTEPDVPQADTSPLLRLLEPFPTEYIGKLPRVTCKDCSDYRKQCNRHERQKCDVCNAWISPQHIHIDYVGHADVTRRLLEVDPGWTWEPAAEDERGLPLLDIDENGNPVGLWIRLTVLGVTRLGYGSCPPKQNDAVKVLIGDCLLAGTPVLTRDGWQPIETVSLGQEVPTRQGWHKVTDHWLSAERAPVMSVLTDNGRVLVATPHHRVPTQRGLVQVRDLQNGDRLFSWPGIGRPPARRTSSGTGAFTDATPTTQSGTAGSTSWPQQPLGPTFTATSMKPSTGRLLRDGTCTTRTTTHSTTPPPISPLSLQASTLGTTPINESRSCIAASIAALTSSLGSGPRTSAGAALAARKPHAERQARSGLAPAPPNHRSSALALNAELLSPPPSRGRRTAAPRVVAVLDAGVGEVWNLSVANVHEYVANGLVVSNSLRNAAMRFGVALDLWAKGDRANPSVENAVADGGNATRRPGSAPVKTDHVWLTAMENRIAAAASHQELQTIANEITAKVDAGGCEQVHHEHLWTLGEARNRHLAAEREKPTAPAAVATAPADTAEQPGGTPAERFEARLAAVGTLEDLAQLKTDVMGAFKAQEIDPTAGNKLLRAIKAKNAELETAAAA